MQFFYLRLFLLFLFLLGFLAAVGRGNGVKPLQEHARDLDLYGVGR